MLSQWLIHFPKDGAVAKESVDCVKPTIGISACLLGRPVRYDGETKSSPELTALLQQHIKTQEFCPEVGIGLPVPRPPIHAVAHDTEIRIVGVHQPENDFTDALTDYAKRIPKNLHGFLLKARSPSCAVGSAPLVDRRGEKIDLISGQFSHSLQRRFPCMPICDESALFNNRATHAFLLCVYLYQRWHTAPKLLTVYQWRDALTRLGEKHMDRQTSTYLSHFIERLAAHSQ